MDGECGDPVRIPVTDVFDLHSVPPRDVEGVVEAYLEEAHSLGLKALRIIHGRGIGVQRETVRSVLARTPFVSAEFCARVTRSVPASTHSTPTPGK